jgi:hypothetical protein
MNKMLSLIALIGFAGCQSMPTPEDFIAGTICGVVGGTRDALREIRGKPRAQPAQRVVITSPNKAPAQSSEAKQSTITVKQIEDAYRTFKYEDTITLVERFIQQTNANTYDRARAHILAGAASYVLGDTQAMDAHLRLAVHAQNRIYPKDTVYPEAVCRRHREIRGF